MDVSNTHMLDEAVVTTTIDTVINWGREASLWPFVEPPVVLSNLCQRLPVVMIFQDLEQKY